MILCVRECLRLKKVRNFHAQVLIHFFFSLSFCMCIFRTSPPQMTSDLGTALRPWSLSRCVAPTNIRTDWSYAVNHGTHPQSTHLTHPKETSRLKCEENAHLQQTERQLNPRMYSSARLLLKDLVLVRTDQRWRVLYSIFSHRDVKWKSGAWRVW